MEIIRVIAAIVDTERLTLYKEDGSTEEIPQGDVRLAQIVAQINPILAVPGAVAEVDLDYGQEANPYTEYEEKSFGLVKFFRVAKKKVAEFFNKVNPVEPMVMGAMVQQQGVEPAMIDPHTAAELRSRPSTPAEDEALNEMLSPTPTVIEPVTAVKQEALAEILKHAVPASSSKFRTQDLGATNDKGHDTDGDVDTVIAMVGERIVPDAHKLAPQIVHANTKDDPMALAVFMERLAQVAEQRSHSAEDLLKFMSRGDLPIADDGSIVIYKILKKSQEGRYVDCHTAKVSQTLGSYVHMDAKLVDPNRRNECSNGLHVARRQYLGGFSGNVCVLAKVRPEDVIAVPDYDANKMRVRGYHILFELSESDFNRVKSNNPLQSEQGLHLLTRALRGDHPDITELVEITEHGGGGVKITKVGGAKQTKAKPVPKTKLETPVAPLVPAKEVKAPKLDPKAVAQQHEVTKGGSQKEEALRLWNAFHTAGKHQLVERAQALMDFKKRAKKSWEALGLYPETGDRLMVHLGNTPTKPQERVAGRSPAFEAPYGKGGESVPGDAPLGCKGNEHKAPGPRDKLAALMPINTAAKAATAKLIKRTAKKSWEALGVSDRVLMDIERLLGADKK